ncbi:HAD-IIA family hydrolase [Oryzobacter telluris]|uniref:HAD-IIA family hydrolase n=1 Tax=Oryzobacter telluris TaxID=3149179 RepID=UPI00370D6B7A
MTETRAGRPLVAGYAAVVSDLDGVVYRGPAAVPGAVEALTAVTVPVIYATNNASRPAEVVAEHLRELGLTCTPGMVATSSEAGAWLLSDRLEPGAQVLAVGGPAVALALREVGLSPVTAQDRRSGAAAPVAALQGYGPDVTASDLAEVAYAAQDGALWVATNTDASLPTDRGVAPGNGSLVAAVRGAVGRDPDLVAGKPEAPLYLLCARRLQVAVTSVLAVGDRLDTDIEGAVAAGADSLLVLTGVDDLAACLAAPRHRRPTWVAPDLSALHADPSAPSPGGSSLVDLAAAVAAVHDATDRGAPATELATLTSVAERVLAQVTHR